MSHKRGEIVQARDYVGDTFFKVFTGCKWLDDYYTVSSLSHAKKLQAEMLEFYNNGERVKS